MKYTLGLDIGTSSVGWAVLDEEKLRFQDLGVRIFERPENPQTGDSLALPRREARSARRRLKRRRQRLDCLKNFFVENNILDSKKICTVLDAASEYNALDVYDLRSKALQQEISPEELFKVLYVIAKRRGYKSNRKVVEEGDAEGGRVSKALKNNQVFLSANSYQTIGEALDKDQRFIMRKRNGRNDYVNSFSRQDFIDEATKIVEYQQKFSLKNVTKQQINNLLFGLVDEDVQNKSAIFYQRPFATKELIEKMIGSCTLEPSQKRSPRASYSFELFRLANNLVNARFISKDTKSGGQNIISLTPQQIDQAIAAAKTAKSFTYGKLMKAAGISDNFRPYDFKIRPNTKDPDGYDVEFGNFKAFHDLRNALSKKFPESWEALNNEDSLNAIAYILTTERSDADIKKSLLALKIPEEVALALMAIKPTNFRSFGHLSIVALKKITGHMLEGMTYDKALVEAGYSLGTRQNDLNQITNPVVKRAIIQTDKVVTAVIRKYGAPHSIHIETARDLAKSKSDRDKIRKEQEDNRKNNKKYVELLKAKGVLTPNGQQITKLKLYNEQNGKCLYSGQAIDFDTLIQDDNAYQVDHIVPFSRSNNDGLTNKVLVYTSQNQLKRDRTPYEYFGTDASKWEQYVALVEATYLTRDVKTTDKQINHQNYIFNSYAYKKKNNLLLQEFKNDSWNVRALNDTRYITKFVKNHLEQTVNMADGPEKQRIFAPSGTTTAYLRKRWGVLKDRQEDVLHHAKDAAVVAATNSRTILQANLYAKKHELGVALKEMKTKDDMTDKLTGEIIDIDGFTAADKRLQAHIVMSAKHFPAPWEGFGKEVMLRTRPLDTKTMRHELGGLPNYDKEFIERVKPIFVSRAPRRKASGAAHKESLRSPKATEDSMRAARVPIEKIKLKDLENSLLKVSDKNLYLELKKRLTENGDNPEVAFKEPVYKNSLTKDKHGTPIAPVSTIKVLSKQPSGFLIAGGKAFVNNSSIVRVDIFSKNNSKGKKQHYVVPVYTHQIPLEKRGEKITKIFPAPKEFCDVDEMFEKVCSLFPNDFVVADVGGRTIQGYFVRYHVSAGQIFLIPQHAPNKEEKTQISFSPRNADTITRYDISILGDNAPQE